MLDGRQLVRSLIITCLVVGIIITIGAVAIGCLVGWLCQHLQWIP